MRTVSNSPFSTKELRGAMALDTEQNLRRHLFVWHPYLYRHTRNDGHRLTAEAHYDLHSSGPNEYQHGHKH